MSVNVNPAENSSRIGIPLVDTATGMQAAMGIMFALFERERSGKGQLVEVTLFDTAIALLHPHTANVLNGGKSSRTGNGHPNIVPYRSEEHTSALQSLMRISYAVFCLK